VLLDDGVNVAEKMLRDGFAYEYTYSKAYEYQKVFKIAEQDARDNERGLWSSESCGGNR
jgi:endonuclease YncB( thermonuclease family)